MATFDQYAAYSPGDRLILTGDLEVPPVFPNFDYRGYLARSDTVATLFFPKVEPLGGAPGWQPARLVSQARNALEDSLQRSLPEPEASLAAGIAFGRDGNIPDELYSEFRTTGLAHIVAVSGSNVSIVAALVFAVFVPMVGRRMATWPAAATVAAYLVVAGLSASVVRAGIMAAAFLVGEYLGRQQTALTALGAAAIAMTAVQPAARARYRFPAQPGRYRGPHRLRALDSVRTRTGAQPSSAQQPHPSLRGPGCRTVAISNARDSPHHLDQFRPGVAGGPIANVIVEPIFAVAFWLSTVTALAGTASTTLGRLIGIGAYLPLSFMTWFAREAAQLPAAAIDVRRLDAQAALLAYTALGVLGIPAYLHLAPSIEPAPVRQPAFPRVAAVSFGWRRSPSLELGSAPFQAWRPASSM